MPISKFKHRKVRKTLIPAPETQVNLRDFQQPKPTVFMNPDVATIMSVHILQEILEEIKRQKREKTPKT